MNSDGGVSGEVKVKMLETHSHWRWRRQSGYTRKKKAGEAMTKGKKAWWLWPCTRKMWMVTRDGDGDIRHRNSVIGDALRGVIGDRSGVQ